MSGLDGLGWPNPEDEPKPKKTMNSQLEIKLATTPETDDATLIALDIECGGKFEAVHVQVSKRLERERDQFSKTLGEVREILCDALPNENQLTSFMAATLVRERDEWKAKYIQQNKDLGCEQMDPNGTIWDYAKKVQTDLASMTEQRDRLAEALRKLADCDWVITPHDRMDAVREIARKALQSLNQPTKP